MPLRALLAAGAAATLFLMGCGGGQDYPTDLDDESYDLETMSLTEAEVPRGMVTQLSDTFNNEEWALIVGDDDPDLKRTQLDAQGRLRNHITLFTREDPSVALASVLSITSQSTLYVDEDSAAESARGLCGLLLNEADPLDEFSVPKLGDESTGFFVTSQTEGLGTSIDTTVCFRTGRVVHAVVQSGFNGSQDIALSVRLAQRMLDRVEAVYAGELPPAAENGEG